ncbi:MAG: ATP-binding protein [Candidatus Parvarchaeota archaeon]|nr:ATP-binding protein [Candidatus Jingweiarchaeum tengchongense]MCW1300460.1 ATP-binding protein [Candidatus Jingweiarchaeum tengchongense]MCW1305490.1 ATP-binding protein [Candidatus Jingweiarchaeum tengchongense]MCW1310309.1 ATP-binding protein [Candidatus Jingweiarchaeum tengchongense]
MNEIPFKAFRIDGTTIELISIDKPIETNKLVVLHDKKNNERWLAKITSHRVESVSQNPLSFIVKEWFKGEEVDYGEFFKENPFFEYYIINEGKIVAKIGDRDFERVRTLPSPAETQVLDVDESYSRFFNKTLTIGALKGNDNISVGIPKAAFNRHIGIFGMTGCGKTNLAANIIAEAISNLYANVIVIDTHADLSKKLTEFGIQRKFSDRMEVMSVEGKLTNSEIIRINPSEFHPRDDWRDIFMISDPQLNIMQRAHKKDWRNWIGELKKAEEFIEREKSPDGEIVRTKRELESFYAVMRRLNLVLDEKIFDINKQHGYFYSKLMSVCNRTKSIIMDLSGIMDERIELLVCNYIARVIFKERFKMRDNYHTQDQFLNETKPIWLVIEEAHRLLRENEFFINFVKEARKNNICLFFIEQDPSGIEVDILKQVGTKLAMTLIHKDEIQALKDATSIQTDEELMQQDKGDAQLMCEVEDGYVFPVPIHAWKFEGKYVKEELI